MRYKFFALLFLTLMLFTAAAKTGYAQLEPYFAEEKQLSPNNFIAFWPAIAINNRDEIMVVYVNDDGTLDIYYRMSFDGGLSWTSPIKTGLAPSAAKAPELATTDDGDFCLLYSDGGSSAIREIYYSRFTNGQWIPRQAVSNSVDNATWCALAVDGDDVYAAWYEELGSGAAGISNIHFKQKKIGGEWPTEPDNASNDLNNGHLYPDIKVIDGHVYMIFQVHQYELGEVITKYIAFKERIDGIWQPTFELGKWAWPDIEVDAYGIVHCLYPDTGNNANYRMRNEAGNWSGQVAINPKSVVPGFYDQVYRNDTMISTYIMDAAQNPSRKSVYIVPRKYENGNWGNFGTPVEVDSGGEPDLPRLAFDSKGYVHIVWIDWTSTVTRNPDGLYYQKFLAAEPDAPTIQVGKTALTYEFQEGEPVDPQTFRVRNVGASTLPFEVNSNQSWLSVTPSSGTSEGEWITVTAAVDTTTLLEGTHTATITVSSETASNSPRTVRVTVTVLPPPVFAVQNVTAQKFQNISFLFRETIHHLTWEPNPRNQDIATYRITMQYTRNGFINTSVMEVTGGTYQVENRMMTPGITYTYTIVAIDIKGRVGPPASTTLN